MGYAYEAATQVSLIYVGAEGLNLSRAKFYAERAFGSFWENVFKYLAIRPRML